MYLEVTAQSYERQGPLNKDVVLALLPGREEVSDNLGRSWLQYCPLTDVSCQLVLDVLIKQTLLSCFP